MAQANIQSGMAAAGGLAMTRSGNHDDSYSQGLVIAFRMITVAIGITVSPLCFSGRSQTLMGVGGALWVGLIDIQLRYLAIFRR